MTPTTGSPLTTSSIHLANNPSINRPVTSRHTMLVTLKAELEEKRAAIIKELDEGYKKRREFDLKMDSSREKELDLMLLLVTLLQQNQQLMKGYEPLRIREDTLKAELKENNTALLGITTTIGSMNQQAGNLVPSWTGQQAYGHQSHLQVLDDQQKYGQQTQLQSSNGLQMYNQYNFSQFPTGQQNQIQVQSRNQHQMYGQHNLVQPSNGQQMYGQHGLLPSQYSQLSSQYGQQMAAHQTSAQIHERPYQNIMSRPDLPPTRNRQQLVVEQESQQQNSYIITRPDISQLRQGQQTMGTQAIPQQQQQQEIPAQPSLLALQQGQQVLFTQNFPQQQPQQPSLLLLQQGQESAIQPDIPQIPQPMTTPDCQQQQQQDVMMELEIPLLEQEQQMFSEPNELSEQLIFEMLQQQGSPDPELDATSHMNDGEYLRVMSDWQKREEHEKQNHPAASMSSSSEVSTTPPSEAENFRITQSTNSASTGSTPTQSASTTTKRSTKRSLQPEEGSPMPASKKPNSGTQEKSSGHIPATAQYRITDEDIAAANAEAMAFLQGLDFEGVDFS
ncbi:MAG: hypothetical protein M1818_002594 [Claussenomyces sp. TS43310]|nr:MAG: hypothetical protein M1818_002594 [Claussenomyces sp. TS43310]